MRIALLGLGEVGRALAEDLTADQLTAWDTGFGVAGSRALDNAAACPVTVAGSAAAAVAEADLIISAVTAANDLAAARTVTPLPPRAWFLDLNSASPQQKQQAAGVIEQGGGRYVEAAVLSPINPKRLNSPILLGGPHAAEFAGLGRTVGFTGLEVYADTIGPASATKLCRSVLVKGMEALMTESMLAARVWGVEDRVLASLANMFAGDDWHQLAMYLISRSLEHGQRRSEEMAEAAVMVSDAGGWPVMSGATTRRQAWAGEHGQALHPGDLAATVDALLKLAATEEIHDH